MATRRASKSRIAGEVELHRLLARLSQPALDRWEADTARVRHLLALDAEAVLRRFSRHQEEAVALFSRRRIREPLLELCSSHFSSITFSELVRLGVNEQKSVEAFHDVLAQLRWYVGATEDMPSAVRSTVAQYVRRLEELHVELRTTLGPASADGQRVIEATRAPGR